MFLKRHDQLWEHIRRNGGNCADRHLTGHLALELIHAATCITDRCQNLPCIINQTTARFSQHNRTRQTIEQRLTDLCF